MDLAVLVNNSSEEDIAGIPLQIIPYASVLKEDGEPLPEVSPLPESFFDFVENAGACIYQGFESYGSGTAEIVCENSVCTVNRLDAGTDAAIRYRIDGLESCGYLKYEILAEEATGSTEEIFFRCFAKSAMASSVYPIDHI